MQQRCQLIARSAWFHRVIVGAILLAGLLAGLETNPALVQAYRPLLRTLDLLVLALFSVEIALKIAAHGRQPWRYFQDGWNVFDFIIVAVCCLPLDSQFAAVFRLARGLRLLRLVTVLPKLQLLVGALLKSLGAMGYVTLLLALLFYLYGVAGVHLFGPGEPKYFGSLSNAWMSLFRLITLDNWSDIFLAAAQHSRLGAVLYFISFIMFGTMIMLNLFIGIIMNSMAEMHAELGTRDRARHLAESGQTTVSDDLRLLEHQLETLKDQTVRLRHRLQVEAKSDSARREVPPRPVSPALL